MKKIAVINITSFGREFPEHIVELEKTVGPVTKMLLDMDMDGKTLAEKLAGYTYVLLGNYPSFNQEFFENNTTVKLIARHGIGYNNIDIVAAKNANVIVTRMPNELEVDAVAEQALALVMAVSKNINQSNFMVQQGEWNTRRERIMGYQILGSVVGIIGFGNIGRRFAQIMKGAFSSKLLIYDPFVNEKEINEAGGIKCSLNSLVENSDIVSIHANLTEDNHNLIDEKILANFKSNAILINTARGDLIDEVALEKVLSKKSIFGYGADVMGEEPAKANHPLSQLKNVTLSPHSAIYNLTCMYNMNRKVMEDIFTVERNEIPFQIIDSI